jgi:hypothetical protein
MADILLPRHRSEILHSRAISDDLIDAWPDRYRSFEAGDWETFFRLMRIYVSKWEKKRVSAWKGKVTASGGGVVIKRFDRQGAPTPPPYARLVNDVLFGDPSKGAHPIHYAYRPSYSIKHIDVHPRQPEHPAGRYDLLEPVDVYFCLEGSLKADAVLSADWTDDGPMHTAFSSTSVTTWESKDLKTALPLLQGARTVYVVPDSDFYASNKFTDPDTGVHYFNPSVLYFTRFAAQWLADRKVNTKIAVPWAGEAMSLGKLGIDDYLARGYLLEDLTLEDPYPNALHLRPAVKLTPDEEKVLNWFLVHHGNRGAFKPGEVARVLGIDRKTVWRAYKRFVDLRFMRVWEGKVFELDEHYRMRPHMYVMFELIQGYREFLQSIRVPLPVRRKLRMDRWSSDGPRVLLPPFAGPAGGFPDP